LSTNGTPPRVDPERLEVRPFRRTHDLGTFDSGTRELDAFLSSREVERFEDEGFGRTFLVSFEGVLVAYYTLSSDSLRTEYVEGTGFPHPSRRPKVGSVPAVKIGRLAVARKWQGRGVGRSLVALIAEEVLSLGRHVGVRLLILEAKPEAVAFYEKCGFRLTRETRRERGKRNRTMFLDLRPLGALVD